MRLADGVAKKKLVESVREGASKAAQTRLMAAERKKAETRQMKEELCEVCQHHSVSNALLFDCVAML